MNQPELLPYPTDVQMITELNLGFDPRPESLLEPVDAEPALDHRRARGLLSIQR